MYPYPAIAAYFQVLCTPAEYRQVSEKQYRNPDYWKVLPTYTYAQCPMCNRWYHEPADTYFLDSWGSSSLLSNLNGSDEDMDPSALERAQINNRCPHFLGIHQFVNLHDQIPLELEAYSNTEGEVPYISSHFLTSTSEAFAVLHALPICRIEEDQFVVAYTVFMLTYFTSDPQHNIARHYEIQAKMREIDPEYYGSLVSRAGFVGEQAYDLSYWVRQGQLAWLETKDTDFKLCIGAELTLPAIYQNIAGRRQRYMWNKKRGFRIGF